MNFSLIQAWRDWACFLGGFCFMVNSYRLFFSAGFVFLFLVLFWQPQTTQPDSELAGTGYQIQQDIQPGIPAPIYPTPTSPPIQEDPLPTQSFTPTHHPQPTNTPLPTQEPLPTYTPQPAVDQVLLDFIAQVSTGEAGVLTGVFVEDILLLPVIQQPDKDYMFVSDELGVITEFQSAARRGVTGLLAHNYLSGDLFFDLEIGMEINLVYGDETLKQYRVAEIERFEKIDKWSNNSDYVNIQTGERFSTQDLFARMYSGGDKVTFQTCIKKGSDWSWGRIFIVATPIE
jgi:hypothetical protein